MKPCNVCKGKFEEPCMFCGFKKPKKKKFFKKKPTLTNAEIVTRDGKREEIMCMNKFSHMSLKFSNCTTKLPDLDSKIEKHRVFGKKLYYKVHVEHKSLTSVADEFDLTLNQVKQILATTLFQINQGAADHPEPEREGPKKPTEEEIAEIRRIRDLPKIPKRPTFIDMEILYDEPVQDEIGHSELA